MFGYIRPYNPELKMKEYEAYKAVYCGLCGQLGRSFGWFSRLTLSFDFTFLSMLHMAMSEEEPAFDKCRCCVNPFKGVVRVTACGHLDFSAAVAMIMLYHKLMDNRRDSGFFGRLWWGALTPFAARARRKALLTASEADILLSRAMVEQAKLEDALCDSVDAACEPTASALSGIFALLSEDPGQRRVLERLGYLMGRFVYLCDALDDMEEDGKRGGYNPFILRAGKGGDLDGAVESGRDSLYLTIGEIIKAYDLLSPRRFQPILHNTVNYGLKASVDAILMKKGKKE